MNQTITNSQKDYDYAVYIGRFQPFHYGHLHCVSEALAQVRKLIIVIGSVGQARSIRNPWSFAERKQMIRGSMTRSQLSRTIFVGVADSLYEPGQWRAAVRTDVNAAIFNDQNGLQNSQAPTVALIGHFRDCTSQYLKQFPEWKTISVNDCQQIHATQIRSGWFDAIMADAQQANRVNTKKIKGNMLQQWSDISRSTLSSKSIEWMKAFAGSAEAQTLATEAKFIKHNQAQYSDLQWPVIHVTADAVVVQNDKVLMIKRKRFPGRGLWALPGGFVNANERIEDAILRELKEETCFGLSAQSLAKFKIAEHVFDDPNRSSRGRTITHAGLILLADNVDCSVEAADDASQVQWVSLKNLDAKRYEVFEDHFYIIRYFENRYLASANNKMQNRSHVIDNNKQGGYCYE